MMIIMIFIPTSPHLHPVVLFQRNEIFPKVCYVCFLLSETGVLLIAQIFLRLKPVEMREDLSQLPKLFPKLFIFPLNSI